MRTFYSVFIRVAFGDAFHCTYVGPLYVVNLDADRSVNSCDVHRINAREAGGEATLVNAVVPHWYHISEIAPWVCSLPSLQTYRMNQSETKYFLATGRACIRKWQTDGLLYAYFSKDLPDFA